MTEPPQYPVPPTNNPRQMQNPPPQNFPPQSAAQPPPQYAAQPPPQYGAPSQRPPQFVPPQGGQVQLPRYDQGAGPAQPVVPVAPPTQVVPLKPPDDGRVVVQVNRITAGAIGGICVVLAIAIVFWQQYEGNLFDWTDGTGRVSKGTIFFHLLPLILIVVAIIQLVRLLDSKPKIIFEAPGVQVRDKTAADGVRRVPWAAVGRVHITQDVATGKNGKPKKNQRAVKKWTVIGRDGSKLASVAVGGHKPDPDIGLGQVAAIAQGRTQVG